MTVVTAGAEQERMREKRGRGYGEIVGGVLLPLEACLVLGRDAGHLGKVVVVTPLFQGRGL